MNSFVPRASSAACAPRIAPGSPGAGSRECCESRLGVAHRRLGSDRDLVELAGPLEQVLSGGQGEPCERRAPDRGDGSELDDARDPKLVGGPLGLDADRLPDLEALLVRPSSGR